jgi:hypothetical protein
MTAGFRRYGRVMMALCLVSLVVERASAFEVKASVSGCEPGGFCGWSIEVRADRSVSVLVVPQGPFPPRRLAAKFTISVKEFEALRRAIEAEAFFSLPAEVGDAATDNPVGNIHVRDGSRERAIRLELLPQELAPIWKTDVGAVGRAFRVCETLRSLTRNPVAMRCPGVP